jgi:hypothetical protein
VREAYLQKQKGVDSQQKETKRENDIGRDLWQNFDLSKSQIFEAKNKYLTHTPQTSLMFFIVFAVGKTIGRNKNASKTQREKV